MQILQIMRHTACQHGAVQ